LASELEDKGQDTSRALQQMRLLARPPSFTPPKITTAAKLKARMVPGAFGKVLFSEPVQPGTWWSNDNSVY